jgi:hypothetical protein
MWSHRLSPFVALGREVFPSWTCRGTPAVGHARSANTLWRGKGGSRAQGSADRVPGSLMSSVRRLLAQVLETGRFSRLVSTGSSSTFGKPGLLS